MVLKIVIGAVLLIVSLAFYVFMNVGKISGEEARALVDDGALLLDVRTAEEFAAGHLPGASNISVGSLQKRLGELSDRSRTIVVYCRSGTRSGRARRILEAEGFTTVKDLGGMSRW